MSKPLDYLIVGLGIAGISICEELQARKLSFKVFNTYSKCATAVSGGILNPTVLKWFTTPPHTEKFYPKALDFYASLQNKLKGNSFYCQKPIYRIFASYQEQNNWMAASDKVKMKAYLNPDIVSNGNPNINAPYGMGIINQTAQIDIQTLIDQYVSELRKLGCYHDVRFLYDQLRLTHDTFEYKGTTAKHIVFCEGISVLNNPFFKDIALKPGKGEYLIVHAPDLKATGILKGKRYLIPLGADTYKVGATFGDESDGLDWEPSDKAFEILKSDIEEMIACAFTIKHHFAGIRPLTPDNKPILKQHSAHPRMACFNGLGMRGLTTAPYYAGVLIDCLESANAIPTV